MQPQVSVQFVPHPSISQDCLKDAEALFGLRLTPWGMVVSKRKLGLVQLSLTECIVLFGVASILASINVWYFKTSADVFENQKTTIATIVVVIWIDFTTMALTKVIFNFVQARRRNE